MTNCGPHSAPGGLLINFATKRSFKKFSLKLGRRKLLRGRVVSGSKNEFSTPTPPLDKEASELTGLSDKRLVRADVTGRLTQVRVV